MFAAVPCAAATTVVRVGTAAISHDADAGTWIVSTHGASLTLALDPTHDFRLVGLVSPSGERWTIDSLPDTSIQIGGQTLAFGSRSAGFVYQDVKTSVKGFTVRLDATFDLPSARLRVTRHYAATSGSPTFETWTTFAALSGVVNVSNLNAFRLTVMAGTIHWLTGLQGDDLNTKRDSAFTIQQRDLAIGARLSLGASGRSSEETVPWFAIDGAAGEFFAGLLWSGAWSLTATRTGTGLDVTIGLPAMTTAVSAPVDGPRAFFGATRGGIPEASAALQAFIIYGLREGRPLDALVTYNTWFAYGVDIDETSIRKEIDGAAALGAELFVVDAGWYAGAGRGGASDFSSGLGTWQVDAGRFPNGLKQLTDYAHGRGLKFGLWVEPERVALATINRADTAQEPWLARAGGKYGSSDAAQLCFASAAARQWVLDRITRLIDSVQPDYLKWDNNFWINCDRTGHGHDSTDGNFTHVNGLYQVLSNLRARYPKLLIENVSGGGNRLDLGMLRYSDTAWMNDRSVPSVHVRHMIEGLGRVFPPAYLLSFVMNDRDESLHQPRDVSLYFRSRMTGILGLCFRTGDYTEGELAEMGREIDIYKTIRGTLNRASGALLTPQASAVNGPPWDAFQATGTLFRSVVSVFQWDPAAREVTVKPVGLSRFAAYEVRSVDAGLLGFATGAELMDDGVRLLPSPNTAAHLLVLTVIPRMPR